MVMNLKVPHKVGNFMTNCKSVTLLQVTCNVELVNAENKEKGIVINNAIVSLPVLPPWRYNMLKLNTVLIP